MGYDHEFGQSKSAEDGMVQGLKVCHLELDVLHTVVFFYPKGNWQCYRTNRCSHVSCNDAVEWSLAWGECDSSRTCKLGTLFVSVKYVLVSVKLVCVYVKLLKNLNASKRGIFIITEKLGLFLQNVFGWEVTSK
jgi:hypothetical protein